MPASARSPITSTRRGDVATEVYSCDLSYDYVKINADYRS